MKRRLKLCLFLLYLAISLTCSKDFIKINDNEKYINICPNATNIFYIINDRTSNNTDNGSKISENEKEDGLMSWAQGASILAAFSGGSLGAMVSHQLDVRRKRKEEEEQINHFKIIILKQLREYAAELSDSGTCSLGTKKQYQEDLKQFIRSLKFYETSTNYYKLSKEDRDIVGSILELLDSGKYDSAKETIESCLSKYEEDTP